MPDPKTIEIDEIVTADPSADDDNRAHQGPPSGPEMPEFASGNPFSDLEKSLPWRARWTLRLTRWLMLLRSKPWGKFILIPAIAVGLLLAIPLGLIFFSVLAIRSLLRSFFR